MALKAEAPWPNIHSNRRLELSYWERGKEDIWGSALSLFILALYVSFYSRSLSLFVFLSRCFSFCLALYPSFYPRLFLSRSLSLCLSMSLFVSFSISVYVDLYLFFLFFISLSTSLFTLVPFCLFSLFLPCFFWSSSLSYV